MARGIGQPMGVPSRSLSFSEMQERISENDAQGLTLKDQVHKPFSQRLREFLRMVRTGGIQYVQGS